MRNEKLRSVDGKELTIYVWDEVESPKAVLQLSHRLTYFVKVLVSERLVNGHVVVTP